MDYKELIENLKAWDEEYISSACGEASLHCEHFCIPGKDCLVTQAVTAITDLLARAETAEQKVNDLDRALSDASKIVNTMQESTIPFYRRRAEEAEADNARLRELVEADRDGRCVVLPSEGYTDKDGENALKSAMNTCFYHNNHVTQYIADAVAEKLTREEDALKGDIT